MPVCCICNMTDDDPVEYGEFMKKSDVCAHYYCLLLSTHLPQNGSDSAGILGFLVRDIRKEAQNCKTRTCIYCHQPNASIACFKCKQYFHQICGHKNDCVSEFVNEFHSYCHEHVPFKNERMVTNTNSLLCWICTLTINNKDNPIQSLGAAHCCQNGYVHRSCLRNYALSAGYHLLCLWCRTKEFRDFIRKRGVFVPDREANWDNNETQRFVDLHRGYSHCDATKCICPQGREFFRATWKLMVCCVCGASGVHSKCAKDLISRDKYTCSSCAKIIRKGKKKSPKNSNGLNSTMFMSKTFEASDEKKTVTSKRPEDVQEPRKPQAPQGHQEREKPQEPQEREKPKEPQQREKPQENQGSSTSSSQKKPALLKELDLFDKDSNIIGTVKVMQDKIQREGDKFFCKEEDIVEFSSSDKLLQSIFADIVAEGRELSMDMVDEVFDRYKLYLETFGDCDC